MTASDRQPPDAAARTYVRRRGRMTRAQSRALEALSVRYTVAPGAIDLPGSFGRVAPLGLEIGFGMGQGLVEWALQRPDWNLLGAEVYEPGVGSALLQIESQGIENVRIVPAAAQVLLRDGLPPESLDEVRIFFPDPWPKKRHHKRRLVEPDMVRQLAERLKVGGLLWVATDWQGYAEWISEVLDAEPLLAPLSATAVSSLDEPAARPQRPATRFEARGLRLGHQVWDFRYLRSAESTPSR